jgi:hypothetical protein
LELTKNNFGVEYLIENSTLQLVGVDSKNFNLKLAWTDFGMESTLVDSIPKSVMENFLISVIMIDYVFIQTKELTLEG